MKKKNKKLIIILVVFFVLIIGIVLLLKYNKIKNNKNKKIINTHWYGRFGNRMFTYAFGCCYAKKYGCKYYYLSDWEGNKLFKNNSYSEPLYNLDKELYNNLIKADGDENKIKNAINKYNIKTNDNIEVVYMDKNAVGKTNIAWYEFNIMYDLFDVYDKDFLKNEVFVFNSNVKNTEIYKNLQKVKNTYFASHVRMGDICDINFKGVHNCIGDNIIKKIPEINKENLPEIIVSENKDIRKNKIDRFDLEKYNNKSKGHHWKKPEGEQYVDEIIFDFLPDFLTLIHAKVLLRSNSSFSFWAGLLNDNVNNIYSPVPNENKENKFNVQDNVNIVKGNHPHFMGSQFKDIIIK